ncbi:MAG: class I SAM-dependent DNA methyltransferase [Armatimonadota bacterium]
MSVGQNFPQFTAIAKHYDSLMSSVPYRQWVDYIEAILQRLDYHPKTVLDLACGTGNVSELLADRGYAVVGVDISPEMIEVARTKSGRVEYYMQDISELNLDNRQFELAICLFDSLNYITDPVRLAACFERVGAHLVPGGLFIFDVNTVYALEHGFFDQANLAFGSYPRYVWTSQYDHRTHICQVDMLFEVMEDGHVKQFKEVHYQRGYSLEELTRWLVEAGFEVLEIFHAYTFRKPARRSDRVFFVARRRAGLASQL